MVDDDIITGSWCSGSLLIRDQLPPHIEAAKRILDWREERHTNGEELEKARRDLDSVEQRQPSYPEALYFKSEEALSDLHILDSILNQFAPDGYYWGPKDDDPTNIGYWRTD